MKGIRLSHGVVFVSDGLYTVRLLANGECGVSPITLPALEWDLRTEPPSSWSYLAEEDIKNLPNNGYEKIQEVFAKIRAVLGD